MFNRRPKKRTYQYGSDPKHRVKLTEVEAHAINNLRIYEFDEKTGYARVNSDEVDMEAYNRAAEYLNQYIARNGGSIPCEDAWLENHEILTLIK
jgi:hypothetical protein